MRKTTYHSNGKLLLTGEYAVLDGAKALAIPTTFGQKLTIAPHDHGQLEWESLDMRQNCWFESKISLPELQLVSCSDKSIAQHLLSMLQYIRGANSDFLAKAADGVKVTTSLDFPRNWGLGTSSTLINNMAQWGNVNPYDLLKVTFGGSGYDVACASHDRPIIYQLVTETPKVTEIDFSPSFAQQLFFVYLNAKQNSREAIGNYRSKAFNKQDLISKIDGFTEAFHTATELGTLEAIIEAHEAALSEVLHIAPIKSRLFNDYWGAVKSLGGWGGDFILATGNEKTPDYFKARGFETVIPFTEMLL